MSGCSESVCSASHFSRELLEGVLQGLLCSPCDMGHACWQAGPGSSMLLSGFGKTPKPLASESGSCPSFMPGDLRGFHTSKVLGLCIPRLVITGRYLMGHQNPTFSTSSLRGHIHPEGPHRRLKHKGNTVCLSRVFG